MAFELPEEKQSPQSPNLGYDPDSYLPIVKAALEPGEGSFYKYMGLNEDGPGFTDYLMPQGKYRDARHLRDQIRMRVLSGIVDHQEKQISAADPVLSKYPGFPLSKDQMMPGQMMPGPDKQIGPVNVEGMDQMYAVNQSSAPRPPMTAMDASQQMRGIPVKSDPYQQLYAHPQDTGVTATGIEQRMQQDPGRDYHTEGMYGPEQVPMVEKTQIQGPDVGNPKKYLTRAQGDLLKAYEHRDGLRDQARANPSAPLVEYQDALVMERAAWEQEHPGQAPSSVDVRDMQRRARGYWGKGAEPGTAEGQQAAAGAKIKGVEAAYAEENAEAGLEQKQEQTKHIKQQREQEGQLLKWKILNIQSEIGARAATGSLQGKRLEIAKMANEMGLSKTLFSYMKYLEADESIKPNARLLMAREAINKIAPYLDVEGEDPGFFESLFGMDSSGIKITKRGDAPGVYKPQEEPAPYLQAPPGAGADVEPPKPTGPPLDLSKLGKGKMKGEGRRDKKTGKIVAVWDGEKWVQQ